MIQLKAVTLLEDVKLIVLLAKEIWYEHYTAIIGAKQVQYMLANLQSEIAILNDLKQGKEYVLVESNQLAIGYVSYELTTNQLFLSKLYLKKSERGKGTGRFVLAQLKDIAKKNKKDGIVLTVNKNNQASISVYKAFGFILIKEQLVDIGNGYVMDDYIFYYSL
ncbi:Acetyltransferase (GNAT) family protein [Carnobacterium iners]|uniref:Acetyltransferase (GNAT) family protein n=1 Tax=Carnobacterium iners TaxID=1073423 RepID=A0A1X7MR54_9LACT|nr:GNAT family N-acetyltransferase [Carnobacterium iners]SEL15064.1 Acetyltransferase (GNAT) family protein [Carnobacterium iners]SMH27302.1 Acetyltransferase (GNAT) family protein [Carnobacterium iners]